jgi:hypothetical protein
LPVNKRHYVASHLFVSIPPGISFGIPDSRSIHPSGGERMLFDERQLLAKPLPEQTQDALSSGWHGYFLTGP